MAGLIPGPTAAPSTVLGSELPDDPIDISGVSSVTINPDGANRVSIFPTSNGGPSEMRFNGVTGNDYRRVEYDGTRTTGEDRLKLDLSTQNYRRIDVFVDGQGAIAVNADVSLTNGRGVEIGRLNQYPGSLNSIEFLNGGSTFDLEARVIGVAL